jgi:hypothetical protein
MASLGFVRRSKLAFLTSDTDTPVGTAFTVIVRLFTEVGPKDISFNVRCIGKGVRNDYGAGVPDSG